MATDNTTTDYWTIGGMAILNSYSADGWEISYRMHHGINDHMFAIYELRRKIEE